MKCYNLVDNMKMYNLNEIVDLIKDYLYRYNDFNLMKNNLNMLLQGLKNNIDNVKYNDDYLCINLCCTGLYSINTDRKNYPLMSFVTERIIFKLNTPMIKLNDDMYFNLNDNLKINNIVRIE